MLFRSVHYAYNGGRDVLSGVDLTVRAGERWLRLVRHEAEVIWSRENGTQGLMRFTIEGRLATHVGDVEKEDREEEMDMQAEEWARELMQ